MHSFLVNINFSIIWPDGTNSSKLTITTLDLIIKCLKRKKILSILIFIDFQIATGSKNVEIYSNNPLFQTNF